MLLKVRLLVLGATGLLGFALCREVKQLGFELLSAARSNSQINLDLTDFDSLRAMLDACSPDIIINAAANVNVKDCEDNPQAAKVINAILVTEITSWCSVNKKKLVQISSDHFFEGDGDTLHDETAKVQLLNQYAKTKYMAEEFALAVANSLIIRTNIAGFHPDGRGFANWAIDAVSNRKPMNLYDDYYTSTIDTMSFSKALLDLIKQNASGLINIASSEVSSKKEFVTALAKAKEIELTWASSGSVSKLWPRRANSLGLDVTKAEKLLGRPLPNLQQVCANLIEQCEVPHAME